MVVGEIVEERDVVIIGGGPGGYHAAIRAAHMGKRVTLIEKETAGGICLTKGCIPSKLFATAARKVSDLHTLSDYGIHINKFDFDLPSLHNKKVDTISKLKKGIEALIQSNEIEYVRGSAYFLSKDRIGVENEHSFTVYRYQSAVIATGGKREHHPVIDHKKVFDCSSIYSIDEIPEHLAVIGADYLALETASTFQQLGSKVSLIIDNDIKDFPFDSTINKELIRLLKKKKIRVFKGKSIKDIVKNDQIELFLTNDEGEESILSASHVVYATKLIPNTDQLGIDRLGMKMDLDGFIEVDRSCRTSIKGIYAAGDVTPGPSLAIKAIKQGKVAADHIGGEESEIDPAFIPTIIHMNPPVSFVGLTEEQARQQYDTIKAASFPLGGNGFATVSGERDGCVKVITDAKTDLILGIHMIGHGAIELASASALALEMVARIEDLTFIHYPHPSINEGMLEAFEALDGKAVHLAPKKQVSAVER